MLKQSGSFAEAVGVPHLQTGSGVFVACAQLPLGTAMPAVLGMVGQWLVVLHSSRKTLILVFKAQLVGSQIGEASYCPSWEHLLTEMGRYLGLSQLSPRS